MDDERPAREVYDVVLDAKPDVGFVRGLGYAVLGALATLGVGDSLGVPGDLVVRRRTDGRELLRTDAGGEETAAQALGEMRRQLETMSAAEFAAAFDLDDDLDDPA